jgi:hypothetical protein
MPIPAAAVNREAFWMNERRDEFMLFLFLNLQ